LATSAARWWRSTSSAYAVSTAGHALGGEPWPLPAAIAASGVLAFVLFFLTHGVRTA
jgi:hypothetical protein